MQNDLKHSLDTTLPNAMKKINTNSSVLYAKYNPYFISDMILPIRMKSTLQKAVTTQKLKHYGLFSTQGGLGKSALCHAIIREIGGEAMWINASIDRGIDVMRGKIGKFASSSSFDDNVKIVVMDEFDNFSKDGQAAFRGFIDEFGSNCCFIFTGNHQEKIIEPLLTRLEVYDFANFKKKEMVKPIFNRLEFILKNEKIEYIQKDIITIMNSFYPSIREMIGAIDQFSISGKLEFTESDLDTQNVYEDILKLLSPLTFFDMIKKVNELSSPNNMYSFLYKNAHKHFKLKHYPEIIRLLAKYEAQSSGSRCKHLQLSGCLTSILQFR